MTSARDLQEHKRAMQQARRLRRMVGDSALGGRSGLPAPVQKRSHGVSGDVVTQPEPLTNGGQVSGQAQLLMMAASGDSIASGGDYVAFSSIVDQEGFADVVGAGASFTHPIDGVYVLEYEHAWDSYEGGGTVELELAGTVVRTVASGTSGRVGRGSVLYLAAKGQAGKIKVTQSSGSGQTCDATVSVGVSDPARQAAPAGSVLLFADGDLIAEAAGDTTTVFSGATLLMGELSAAAASSSDFVYDTAQVLRDGVNLVGNAGFESALLSTGSDRTVANGNWRAYHLGTGVPARVASPVHAGSWAGQVPISAGVAQGGYFLQDVALSSGDGFDIDVMVRPGSGTQMIEVALDWDRTSGAAATAAITISPTATTLSAFGLTASSGPLPYGEWSNVVLRVVST